MEQHLYRIPQRDVLDERLMQLNSSKQLKDHFYKHLLERAGHAMTVVDITKMYLQTIMDFERALEGLSEKWRSPASLAEIPHLAILTVLLGDEDDACELNEMLRKAFQEALKKKLMH